MNLIEKFGELPKKMHVGAYKVTNGYTEQTYFFYPSTRKMQRKNAIKRGQAISYPGAKVRYFVGKIEWVEVGAFPE